MVNILCLTRSETQKASVMCRLDTLQTSFVKPIATVTPESKVTDEIPRGRDDQQNIEIFKLLQTVTNQNQVSQIK